MAEYYCYIFRRPRSPTPCPHTSCIQKYRAWQIRKGADPSVVCDVDVAYPLGISLEAAKKAAGPDGCVIVDSISACDAELATRYRSALGLKIEPRAVWSATQEESLIPPQQGRFSCAESNLKKESHMLGSVYTGVVVTTSALYPGAANPGQKSAIVHREEATIYLNDEMARASILSKAVAREAVDLEDPAVNVEVKLYKFV